MIVFDNKEIIPCQLKYHQGTEREMEVALGLYFLGKFGDIIEIGAVLPYHVDSIKHQIVDPFDAYPLCIRKDAMLIDYHGKNILSISTVEHMGTGDYHNSNINDEYAMDFLTLVRNQSSNFLITAPMGYNMRFQDKFFKIINSNYMILHKIDNNWQETKDISMSYDFSKYKANGILIYSNLVK